MTPKLSQELREALHRHPGQPVEVEDEQTHRVYVIVAREEFRQMIDEELRRQLQIGIDQADAGDVAAWDAEEFRGRMRRGHEPQPS